MTIFAFLALFGWVPAALVIFAFLPSRAAAATAVIGAWLLLPPYTLVISSLPDYSKSTAAILGVLLGTLIFDPNRFLRFRPRWFDLPTLLWCSCGMASSLQNGLGVYDGLSDMLIQSLTWGLPYLIGRLYFNNLEDLRFFAVAIVVGGICYVLPCLYEIRMSPYLLASIYGIGEYQGTRLGGFRPNVFFATGLELGLWMTAASLAGWWLWRCGEIKRIGPFPFGSILLPILLGTTILCRSTGAIALLAFGMMVLWSSVRFRTRLLLAVLLLAGPLYVAVRVTNLWSGRQAVDLAASSVGPDRAESLKYRFTCENLLAEKALEQPIFGWGGWARSMAYFGANTPYRKPVPTDGLWIITLGTKGYVGLFLFYLALILPAALFIRRFPASQWGDPRVAAGSLTTVLLVLYTVDCLLNAFPNMIYMTLAGGLIGLEPKHLRKVVGQADRAKPHAASLSAIATGSGSHRGQIALASRYRGLGRSFKQEGRLHEAESAWRRALTVLSGLLAAEPGSPELRRLWCDCANDVAWLLANHPDPAQRDPNAAVAMARQMVEECPDAEVYWNTLGAAYYRAGDDASAVAALDRATALGGGTAFDDIFLAMAHARLGDREQSELRLTRAIFQMEQDYPGHPELVRFCDEARSARAEGAEASPAAC